MALQLKDRVLETASAPGTGSVTLLGASLGYQSFNTAITSGSTVYYTIATQGGAEWEVGIGTFTATATLSRDTVLSSSAGGTTKANFSSGTQNVWVDYPAEKAVIVNDVGDVLINQSYDQGTGVLQVTGQSTFNGTVVDKTLSLQGGNNLAKYSQDFSNAVWTANATNLSVSGTLYTAPDNTTTANSLILNTSVVSHYIGQAFTPGTLSSTSYTYSQYIKYNGLQFVQLVIGAIGCYCNFDLINVLAGTPSGCTASIFNAGNGWYRCAITFTGNAGVTAYTDVIASNSLSAGVTPSFAGSGTNGYYVWGAQLEIGTVASAYTPTTTAAITTTNNISVPSGSVIVGNQIGVGVTSGAP